VGREHAAKPAGLVDQRGGLDGAKSGSGCDRSVWGEGRIGVDVGDNGLCAGFGGASAYRLLVLDGGEVVKELAGETALGDDPQRPGLRVGELDVSEIGGEERDGAVERHIEQFAQPRSVAEPSRQQVHPRDRGRLADAVTSDGR
jgi:hypothetical protein